MPLTSKLNTIINAPFTPIVVNGLQSGVIAIRITLQNISNLATQPKAKLEQILLDGGVQLIGPSKEVLMNGTARLFLMPFKAGYSIRLNIPNIALSASIQVFEVTGFSLTNQVIVNSSGGNMITFDPALYYTKSEVDNLLQELSDSIVVSPGGQPQVRTSGLQVWYDFKGETGAIVTDKSGNGRNGSLVRGLS